MNYFILEKKVQFIFILLSIFKENNVSYTFFLNFIKTKSFLFSNLGYFNYFQHFLVIIVIFFIKIIILIRLEKKVDFGIEKEYFFLIKNV